ncbi:MAG TPA: hypothetical protein VLZ74_14145 [Methylocella sp.]|nr:hypothetical protein [Methylocella sp.]
MPMTPFPAAKRAPAAGGRRKLFRSVLFLLGGLSAAALAIPAKADGSRTLIIPPNDGYGFEECLKAGSECGLIVADAWCKAHGFGASKSFGPQPASATGAAPGSFQVTCGDRVD